MTGRTVARSMAARPDLARSSHLLGRVHPLACRRMAVQGASSGSKSASEPATERRMFAVSGALLEHAYQSGVDPNLQYRSGDVCKYGSARDGEDDGGVAACGEDLWCSHRRSGGSRLTAAPESCLRTQWRMRCQTSSHAGSRGIPVTATGMTTVDRFRTVVVVRDNPHHHASAL